MIHIVIVEDSLEAREGFKYLLGLDQELKVLRTYDCAEALIADAHILGRTDIILMDIELPGMSGIQATEQIKRRYPAINILILTIFEEQQKIVRAVEAGATGYILKNSDPRDLVSQVKSAYSGGSPISPFMARKLLEEFKQKHENNRDPEDYHLTRREIEVSREIIEGYTYREMAEHLNMAGSTAKKHILNIYKKLDVNSKVEFIHKVLDENLFD